MMRRFVLMGAVSVACLGTLVLARPIAAQQVIDNPDAIRACLCEQQQLTALMSAVQERQANYESSQKTLANLNQELEMRRSQINVYNENDVDAYKQLLAQSDRAAIALADDATPSYNDAVSRYNDALTAYTGRCGGKSYNQAVYSSVQATLSCPRP